MKDINKGDILYALEDLIKTLKNDKRRLAQWMFPEIQNFIDGSGRIICKTDDYRLEFIVTLHRTKEYKREILRNLHS